MTSTSCSSAVPIEFDVYGFAILGGQEAEGDEELEDGRRHVYRSVYYVSDLSERGPRGVF